MATTKPVYRTAPTSLMKKFKAANDTMLKLEVNEPQTGYFFKEPQAQKQWSAARLQKKGLQQRYNNSPRLKAIQKANEQFDSNVINSRQSGGNLRYLGKTRAGYVQRNWKKYL